MGTPGTGATDPGPAGGAIFLIGSDVVCSDGGERGTLVRVVIDPVARRLTHLVVEPRAGDGLRRLVPVELALASDDVASGHGGHEPSGGGVIELACSSEEFASLEPAEEEAFLPGAPGSFGYGQEQMLSLPYFGLDSGIGLGAGPAYPLVSPPVIGPQVVTYDRVPLGELEVRRGAHVAATDGRIGRVEGLVIDPSDRHVTHLLLQEGHLWGKKDVAIPIGAVDAVVDDDVRLRLGKDEVRDLPPVDLAGRS